MAYCSNCKCEYKKGKITCLDCGATLVEKLPEEKTFEYDKEAFLVEVGNEIEAQMIINVLENEGIPCLRRYSSSGDMMKIYGFVNFGSKLYVPSRALERALELIEFQPLELDDTTYEEPVETPLFDRDKWFNIILWLLSGITLLLYLLSVISGK